MAYSTALADRIREYLSGLQGLHIEEKKMFGGLAFLVNGKMCLNVSDDQLMCRFDPARADDVSTKVGFIPLVMKGRVYAGYCYVDPEGYETDGDFAYWVSLCLDYNERAQPSRKK